MSTRAPSHRKFKRQANVKAKKRLQIAFFIWFGSDFEDFGHPGSLGAVFLFSRPVQNRLQIAIFLWFGSDFGHFGHPGPTDAVFLFSCPFQNRLQIAFLLWFGSDQQNHAFSRSNLCPGPSWPPPCQKRLQITFFIWFGSDFEGFGLPGSLGAVFLFSRPGTVSTGPYTF